MPFLDNKDRVGGMLLLAFSLVYLRYAWVLPLDPTATDESFTARTLPIGLSLAAILFSLVQLVASARPKEGATISESVRGYQWQPMLLLLSAMAIYSLAFNFLGFIVSSLLFLVSGFLILGERRVWLATAVAAGLVLFLWIMLVRVFGLYLDAGDLYRMLAGSAA